MKSINKWKNGVSMKIASAMKKMEWLMRSEWQWSSRKKKHKMIWLEIKSNMVNIPSSRIWMRLIVSRWQWRCLRMITKRHQLTKDLISKIWWWIPKDSNKYYKWVKRKNKLESRNRKLFKQMRTSCWWEVYSSLKRRAPKKNNSPSKKKKCFNKS